MVCLWSMVNVSRCSGRRLWQEEGRAPCLSKSPAEDVNAILHKKHWPHVSGFSLESWTEKKKKGSAAGDRFACVLPSHTHTMELTWRTLGMGPQTFPLPLLYSSVKRWEVWAQNALVMCCLTQGHCPSWMGTSKATSQNKPFCKFRISGICYSNRHLTNTNPNPEPDNDITRKENHRPIFLMDTDIKILNKIIPNWTQYFLKRQ